MEDEIEQVYSAEDIQKILKIGKNKLYNFLYDVYSNTHYFKIIKIGKLYRIPKNSFDHWFYKIEE
jgi:hypothetical protein